MSLIDETEREDFEDVCKRSGFQPQEFAIEEAEKPLTGGQIQPIEGYVQITHVPTGKSHSYQAGQGSTWVAQFAIDLKRRHFE